MHGTRCDASLFWSKAWNDVLPPTAAARETTVLAFVGDVPSEKYPLCMELMGWLRGHVEQQRPCPFLGLHSSLMHIIDLSSMILIYSPIFLLPIFSILAKSISL
jgi:hypothetical protein